MTTMTSCPYCRTAESVAQLAQFALPASNNYTNKAVELLQCSDCQQVFLSMYEAELATTGISGALNTYYYYLPQSLQHDLLINATLCQFPDNAACHCALHRVMSELDISQLQRLP